MREGERGAVGGLRRSFVARAALLVAVTLASCRQEHLVPTPQGVRCTSAIEVEGEYRCAGECVVTTADGGRQVVTVSDEVDAVTRFPSTKSELFQVSITSGSFSELEIGALVGDTLRTATATVSDGQYPVLEEYVFQIDSSCRARGFSKIVRGPSKENFKSCLIRGQRSD